jgi:hypothetical protein
MMRPRLLALVLAALLVQAPAAAQKTQSTPDAEARPVRAEVRLNAAVGVPTGSFHNNIGHPGYGLNLFGGVRIPEAPVMVGVDLGALVYGRSVDRVPFSQTVGPRVMVDVVTTNSILQPHMVLRLQPAQGPLRPYIDGLFGIKYLSTSTSIQDEEYDDEDYEIASTTNFSDVALSGGVGAGLDIHVYQAPSTDALRTVSMHVGVQYLIGRRAEYLAEGELRDTNGNGVLDNNELDIRQSPTTLVQPQVGLTMQF